MDYRTTERTVPLRYSDRMRYDRDTVHAILDEALIAHLGFVVDGQPRVLPTLFVRVGDTVYVHGSTGSRPLLAGRTGMDVCVEVTLLDGLVLARSQFHHSANYRSVVVHGPASLVTDEDEKRRALTALVDKIVTGRAADSRAPSDKELAATAVLAVPLDEAAAKVRTGGANDDEADYALPHWAGVVPLRQVAGVPEPADPAVPLPDYLIGYRTAVS